MRSRQLLFALVVGLLSLVDTSTVWAAVISGTIETVYSDRKKVVIKPGGDKPKQTFSVPDGTTITVDGTSTKLANLKSGQQISVFTSRAGTVEKLVVRQEEVKPAVRPKADEAQADVADKPTANNKPAAAKAAQEAMEVQNAETKNLEVTRGKSSGVGGSIVRKPPEQNSQTQTVKPKTNLRSIAEIGAPVSLPNIEKRSWETRIAEIGEKDQIGDLRPGVFALVVDELKPFFCALDSLGKPLQEQSRPIAPFESTVLVLPKADLADIAEGIYSDDMFHYGPKWRQYLKRDKNAPPSLACSPGGVNDGLFMQLRNGEIKVLHFFSVKGETIYYNLAEDPKETQTRREIPLKEVGMLLLPTGFAETRRDVGYNNGRPVPRRIVITYDDKKKFVAQLLLSETEAFADSGEKIGGMRCWIRLLDKIDKKDPKAPLRLTAGDEVEVAINRITSDGQVEYQLLKALPNEEEIVSVNVRQRSRVVTGHRSTPRNVIHTTCSGLVDEIRLLDGSRFSYSAKHRAFLHLPESPLPVTNRVIAGLDRETVAMYESLVSLVVPPKDLDTIKWADLNNEDKLFFEGWPNKSDYPGWFRMPGWKRFIHSVPKFEDPPPDFVQEWMIFTKVTPDEAIRAFFPLEARRTDRAGYFQFLTDVRHHFPKLTPHTWDSLSDAQRRLVHVLVLERRATIAAVKQRDKEILTLGAIILGGVVAYKAGVEPAIRGDFSKSRIKESYALGDNVTNPGGHHVKSWSGQIIGKDGDSYRIRFDTLIDWDFNKFRRSKPGDEVTLRHGQFQ